METLLRELEQHGIRNDAAQTDKALKYLNITRDTGEFLKVLLRATCASSVLEVGTSNGYSTLWLAAALPPGGSVTTIEYSERKAVEATANFKRAGITDKITLLRGKAEELLTGLCNQYDVIFLDADRSKYMDMAGDIMRLLKHGGLIVCDNAISHEHELAEFTSFLKSQPGVATSLVPVGKGEFLAHKSWNDQELPDGKLPPGCFSRAPAPRSR